jgi:hypothetical protein
MPDKLTLGDQAAARRIDPLLIGIITAENQSSQFVFGPSGFPPNLPHNIVRDRHGFLAKCATLC